MIKLHYAERLHFYLEFTTPRFMSSSYSSISLHLGYATDRSQHTRGQTDNQWHYNHNGHFCRLLYQVVVESGVYHHW